MNLETKIIIYKFTPQVFTLTQFSFEGGLASDCKAIFLSVNFLFLKSLSFMSCYSEKSSNFAVR